MLSVCWLRFAVCVLRFGGVDVGKVLALILLVFYNLQTKSSYRGY